MTTEKENVYPGGHLVEVCKAPASGHGCRRGGAVSIEIVGSYHWCVVNGSIVLPSAKEATGTIE